MLVLSRKSSQELVFPALGITIRVLRTSANFVKLGVIAPKNLRVLRGELNSFEDLIESICQIKGQVHSHDFRNRLNTLVLNLELLSRLERQGLTVDDLSFVESVTESLNDLEDELSRLAVPGERRNIEAKPRHAEAKKTRLLVVDDNANERELLAAVLTMQGFEVSLAADGVDAIGHLNEGHDLPHAVLLDMQMPRLNGETTLRLIRTDSRLKNLRVIGISGNEPQMHILPDALRGFDGWFCKPLQLNQLISLINQTESVAT